MTDNHPPDNQLPEIYQLALVFDDNDDDVLRFEPIKVTNIKVRIHEDPLSGEKTLVLALRTVFGKVRAGGCIRIGNGNGPVWVNEQCFPDEAAALEYVRNRTFDDP